MTTLNTTLPPQTQVAASKPVSPYLHLATLPVSTYVTEGLSKIFGFQVLRHGTRFSSYWGILQKGADPTHGGSGSSAGNEELEEHSKNKFHVFKDSEAHLIDNELSSYPLGQLFKRTHPHAHAAISGSMQVKTAGSGLPMQVIVGIANLFCPILRFVYRPSEIDSETSTSGIFEDDPDYQNLAYRTKQALPNDRIGLIGICTQATSADAKRAWEENPWEVLLGVLQLLIGVILTACGLGILL